MRKIVFVGYGAMAQSVYELLPDTVQLQAVVVLPESIEQTRTLVPEGTQVVSHIREIKGHPDLVLEMAGQAGLRAHAFEVLAQRWPLAVVSVGALADKQLFDELSRAARQHQTQVHLLAGAVAGMDGLNAACAMGLDVVLYQGCKPPAGWKGSHAESLIDLDGIHQAQVFFEGTAREAAQLFPANANVAATIGLAGVGLDETRVRLIADPQLQRNKHIIQARGAFGDMHIELQGVPLANNPKTSTLAALSVVRACQQLDQSIVI